MEVVVPSEVACVFGEDGGDGYAVLEVEEDWLYD